MFTLRIILTGMIALGPVEPPSQSVLETWAFLAKADKHEATLGLGCNGAGTDCTRELDLANVDVELWVDGSKAGAQAGLFFDQSFRNYVPDISYVTASSSPPHYLCPDEFTPNPPRRVPGEVKKKLDLVNDIKEPAGDLGPSANLINARINLVGGGVWNKADGRCIGTPYCKGTISAIDIPTCSPYHLVEPIMNPSFNRCTLMANAVVYDLQVETDVVDIVLRSLVTPSESEIIRLHPPVHSNILEVWISNQPETKPADPNKLDHYADLYKIFQSVETVRVPRGFQLDDCNDSPGTFPIRCPVMQFQSP